MFARAILIEFADLRRSYIWYLWASFFARNDYSAQKAYKWLNQRNMNGGGLFFRVASTVLTSPQNEELFAWYDSKL